MLTNISDMSSHLGKNLQSIEEVMYVFTPGPNKRYTVIKYVLRDQKVTWEVYHPYEERNIKELDDFYWV